MSQHATRYDYRAVRLDGGFEVGVVAATSRAAAVALVANRGLYPVEVSRARMALARVRATTADQALGLRALATLLAAGLSTARALAALDGLVPPCWSAALPAIRERIEQGGSLASALRESSLALPPHVLAIIEAGEAGTGIAAAVEGAALLLESRAAAAAALWNALSYPILLAVTGTASVGLLVAVVLPRFADLMIDAGSALPASTKLLIGVTSGLGAATLPALVVAAAAFLGSSAWLARPGGRRQWHNLLLRTPVLGPVRRAAVTARACSTLASLLGAGIPLAAALPLAARAAGDAAVEAALLAARGRIVAGQSFSSALTAEPVLTLTARRFVRIGEETGDLAPMLGHAARIESDDALVRVRRLTRLIEPALILLFGLIVMAVAAALLQAVYGLGSSL